jgi:hypothetical protein
MARPGFDSVLSQINAMVLDLESDAGIAALRSESHAASGSGGVGGSDGQGAAGRIGRTLSPASLIHDL